MEGSISPGHFGLCRSIFSFPFLPHTRFVSRFIPGPGNWAIRCCTSGRSKLHYRYRESLQSASLPPPNLISRSGRLDGFPLIPSNLCQSYYVSAKLPSPSFLFPSFLPRYRYRSKISLRNGFPFTDMSNFRTFRQDVRWSQWPVLTETRIYVLLSLSLSLWVSLWNSIIPMILLFSFFVKCLSLIVIILILCRCPLEWNKGFF